MTLSIISCNDRVPGIIRQCIALVYSQSLALQGGQARGVSSFAHLLMSYWFCCVSQNMNQRIFPQLCINFSLIGMIYEFQYILQCRSCSWCCCCCCSRTTRLVLCRTFRLWVLNVYLPIWRIPTMGTHFAFPQSHCTSGRADVAAGEMMITMMTGNDWLHFWP